MKLNDQKKEVVLLEDFELSGGWGANEYLKGKLDDVRIYDRALTAEEIQILYQLGQ